MRKSSDDLTFGPEPGREKLYQDQVYGSQILSPLAVAIIDTPEFQRLDGLKQLGFADRAYRSARHTRLEHSIGTYFMCINLLGCIQENQQRLLNEHPGMHISSRFAKERKKRPAEPEDELTFIDSWKGLTDALGAAALIHDISHVPFGHTLEDEIHGLYERHDSLANARLHTLLYNDSSELSSVFCRPTPWVGGLSNSDLRDLIYLILSWKEHTSDKRGYGFDEVLKKELANRGSTGCVPNLVEI